MIVTHKVGIRQPFIPISPFYKKSAAKLLELGGERIRNRMALLFSNPHFDKLFCLVQFQNRDLTGELFHIRNTATSERDKDSRDSFSKRQTCRHVSYHRHSPFYLHCQSFGTSRRQQV